MERHRVTGSLETARYDKQRCLVVAASTVLAGILMLLLLAPAASAKEAIAYFGSESGTGTLGGQFNFPAEVAVNNSGVGPADKGDIYVGDFINRRIQHFAQDDNGTPGNPYDDTYPFVSAWGVGVETGASGYEVCTVAASCQAGVESGGNGAVGMPPIEFRARGVAVDQDSGNVYVTDVGNRRVNVYAGDGVFLRSFGFDVVASGPGEVGTGYEVCVAANGDVCKQGISGSGTGQITSAVEGIAVSPADGTPATGTVFLADPGSTRVNTYNLDGSSPSSFGSAANFDSFAPNAVAVDSRGIVYVADRSNGSEIDRYDSQNANGGGVGFLASIPAPPLSVENKQMKAFEIDADSDGAGADTDVLYVVRDSGLGTTVVQQFGPLNKPGLTLPPAAQDEAHGGLAQFTFVGGLGLDESSGRLFVATPFSRGGEPAKSGVYVLDQAGGIPSASLDSLSGITTTSAEVHATVNPNGPPDVTYQLEYSTDGVKWTREPKVLVGSQGSPQAVDITLSPPGTGLEPNTLYHVRLAVTKAFTPAVATAELTFTTLAAPPQVETAGAPLRTTTTAQLGGRVGPRNKATTFHFEYGDQGPCDANPCQSTAPVAAGSGATQLLVAAEIGNLNPDTTYHYRLVADNGAPGSPVVGEDMTVTTRASEESLSHGDFPGPPGSDRAFEMVSTADSGAKPVWAGMGFSDDGNRAVYSIAGGTPISETGSFLSLYFSERRSTAWQTLSISPPRNELIGADLFITRAASDLSTINIRNMDKIGNETFWRLRPDAPAQRQFDFGPPVVLSEPLSPVIKVAADGSRTVANLLKGNLDPAYPGATAAPNLYDVSSGAAKLVSLLPGDVVSPCGSNSDRQGYQAAVGLSDDGRLLIFPSQPSSPCASTPSRLYIRNLETGVTSPLTPTPVSGSECGSGAALRLTDEAFYFWTQDRLSPEDSEPLQCETANAPVDGDVYRYDLGDGGLECVTCVVSGRDADVRASNSAIAGGIENVAVSPDGSRIYFRSVSPAPLIPGVATGSKSTYVLDVATGELKWVGEGITISGTNADWMTPDGSAVIFESSAASLNPLGGGSDNGGTSQVYRYDDTDRSLVCISCPQDGTPAGGSLASKTNISADGDTIGFATPSSLLPGDQNAPDGDEGSPRGRDVYEWRDGRLFLITDGLTDWPSFGEPAAVALSSSGRDLFFLAYAQYTPDALDANGRLYDARIGGGFEYPKPPPPCPLEVCQGTPNGAPEEQAPGTGTFSGLGNKPTQRQPARCAKGKRKVKRGGKTRCVKPAKKRKGKRANDNRRATR